MSSLRVKKTASKPEIADQIGRHLRSVYNDVLVQPVPDRFLELLKDFDPTPPLSNEKKAAK